MTDPIYIPGIRITNMNMKQLPAITYPENNSNFKNIDEMGDFPEPGHNKPVRYTCSLDKNYIRLHTEQD